MSAHAFNPDWTIAPGATLQEWREENHLPLSVAAKACANLDPKVFARIESGTQKITKQIASQLAHGTQIPARLWLNLERHYREGLAAGKADVT